MKTSRFQRSFCKSLFSGKTDQELVFPYPKMNIDEGEIVRIFLESLSSFAKEKIRSAAIDIEGALPNGILGDIAELGVLGMNIPQEYGGAGFSSFAYCRVIEEISRIDTSLAVTVGAHQSLGLKAILLYGTDEQKTTYLHKCASGQWLAGFALTEPGAGSDAKGIRSRAVPSTDNSHYILNGSKQWITNGGLAHVFTVFAKTPIGDGREKISAFIVTRDMKGFSSGKEEKKLGICGSSTTTLSFDNVYVPAGNMIGSPGEGFKIAMEVLNNGRIGLSAGNLGMIKHLISLAIEHAKSRKQFDTTIALFEMVQSKISRMVIDAYVLESMIYLTAGLIDKGDVDFSIEAAICKVYASEASWRTADHALQIAGGIGYSKEYPYERLLRDARINRIFDGTNEILRSIIALSGMQGQGEYLKNVGKALQNPLSEWNFLLEYMLQKIGHIVTTERLSGMHHLLAGEVRSFEKYTKVLHLKAEKCLVKYRKDIINQEFQLERISDMVIDLYAVAAVLSRLNSDLKKREPEQVERQLVIGKAFCDEAWKRIRRNGRQIDANIDPLKKQIAKGSCEADGYSLDLIF
jgi:acyl-CoA dehydrogenase family protein 9